MDTITVTVTEEDIAAGKPGSCLDCPIALAFKRIRPGHKILADPIKICIWESGKASTTSRNYNTSDGATSFMRRFDAGKRVTPSTFTFELEKAMAEA